MKSVKIYLIISILIVSNFVFGQKSMLSKETITAKDSAYVLAIIKELKGIEKYAVKNDFYLLSSLLNYKGDSIRYNKIKGILFKKDDYLRTFIIEKLDTKNGYIKFSPTAAEVTYTMTYWNLKDDSKLIATESWGCGPVCQSEIQFQKYVQDNYIDLERLKIIPDIEKLPMLLAPDYDEKSSDPLEFKFVLPQNGKNIDFCLDKNCIELKWNEGMFIINAN